MPPVAERPAPPADDVETFAGRALGSAVRLTVRGVADRASAGSAWRAVVDELEAVDAALSRFRADSELMRLNAAAGSDERVAVSRRLRVALALNDRARRVTGGRFDARVVDALERIGEHGEQTPAAAPPSSPGRRWPVRAPDVAIDTGGIGKGLALRWAAERALGALASGSGLLLEAGGDLVAAGAAPTGGWLIGIEDPTAADPAAGDPVVVVELRRGALATSSIAVRRWTTPDGRQVHHLIDPRTGAPAWTGLVAVSVAAGDPAWAEVWTKALFLAGATAIAAEARARDLAAWWLDDRGRLGMTPAARVVTAWAAEDRLA